MHGAYLGSLRVLELEEGVAEGARRGRLVGGCSRKGAGHARGAYRVGSLRVLDAGRLGRGQRVCARRLPVVVGRGGRGRAAWQVSRWLQQEGGRARARCLPGGLIAGATCGGGGVGGGRLVGSCGRKGHRVRVRSLVEGKGHRACVRCLPGRLVASARCGGWHC